MQALALLAPKQRDPARHYQLQAGAERDLPDVQPRDPSDGLCGERHSEVGANDLGQTD